MSRKYMSNGYKMKYSMNMTKEELLFNYIDLILSCLPIEIKGFGKKNIKIKEFVKKKIKISMQPEHAVTVDPPHNRISIVFSEWVVMQGPAYVAKSLLHELAHIFLDRDFRYDDKLTKKLIKRENDADDFAKRMMELLIDNIIKVSERTNPEKKIFFKMFLENFEEARKEYPEQFME
jgi:hypothetical protein